MQCALFTHGQYWFLWLKQVLVLVMLSHRLVCYSFELATNTSSIMASTLSG